MGRYVIDASAAAEYLLRTPLGREVAPVVEDAILLAPELLDVDVLAVLRRAVLHRNLPVHRAMLALEDLRDWPIERIAHQSLILLAWRYRLNVSAYDAFYVAAAKAYGAPLLTADGPLARAPAIGITVQNIRHG